jgi:4-diphosphocytidyl-2-C-methyl-D-erythritol kinase
MNFKIIKSYAKVNLSLGVIGKLKSGNHNIESLVSFLNLHDEIKIKKIYNKNHKIKFFGKFSKGIKKKNTIFELLKILDSKNILNNQKYLIKVKKNIPQKSGLGGGSMNASAIIKFLISRKIINFSKKNIIRLSDQIGSDVKLGIDCKNKILHSNGKLKTSSRKNRFFFIVVKPNFGCSTKEIYRNVKKYSQKKIKRTNKNLFVFKNILKLENDLEKIAFKLYPKLIQIKSFMEDLPNIRLVRMTGSGSSMLGYFLSKNSAINATKLFKKKYKNYWCIISKTI